MTARLGSLMMAVSTLVAAACATGDPAPGSAAGESIAEQALTRAPAIHAVHGAVTSHAQVSTFAGPSGNGISYGGGPLMLGTPSVYYIWYGNWAGNTGVTILTDLANTLGGSPYFFINTSYSDLNGHWVTGALRFGGSTTDGYSRGTLLSFAGVQGVVADAINSHHLPLDPGGVYAVLSSADVNMSDSFGAFCTQFCGWHTFTQVGGVNVKFAWIGDAHTRCPGSCMAQSVGPNGNPGADGMASVIAHEVEETVTDPELNAWTGENADMCAWTFGSEYSAGGARANVRLGGRDFLIQRNWVNADGGRCDMTRYPALALDDPRVFDARFYLSANPDLRAAFGNDLAAARSHWLASGIHEGRRASRAFDVQWYLGTYADLRAAFGTDYAAAINHFVQQGLPYEGRRGARELDAAYYRAAYGDLNNYFGPDYRGLALHFINGGIVEGRASAFEVSPAYYLGLYGDLRAAFGATNYPAALDHFIFAGLHEGRRASPTFDAGYYLSIYPDLQQAFGPTNYPAAFDHWVRAGRGEGRRGAP